MGGLRVDIQGTLGKFGYSSMPPEISEQLLSVLVDFAHYTASRKAPVETGKLRGAIQKEIDLADMRGSVFIKLSEIPYAAVAEYGTKRRLPHPYMRPAGVATRTKLKAIIKTAVRQSIEEAKNGNG